MLCYKRLIPLGFVQISCVFAVHLYAYTSMAECDQCAFLPHNGCSDGRLVRTSATGTAGDSNLIPSRVKPMTLKFDNHSFPVGSSTLKVRRGEQAGKFFVVSVVTTLSGVPLSWSGRQVAGNSFTAL